MPSLRVTVTRQVDEKDPEHDDTHMRSPTMSRRRSDGLWASAPRPHFCPRTDFLRLIGQATNLFVTPFAPHPSPSGDNQGENCKFYVTKPRAEANTKCWR